MRPGETEHRCDFDGIAHAKRARAPAIDPVETIDSLK
jgi:hypothetical protein